MAKIEFTPRADAVFPSEDAPGVVDAAFADGCCGKPAQCWEPCGDLGKSAKHVRRSTPDVEAEVDRLLGILPVALAVIAAVCA